MKTRELNEQEISNIKEVGERFTELASSLTQSSRTLSGRVIREPDEKLTHIERLQMNYETMLLIQDQIIDLNFMNEILKTFFAMVSALKNDRKVPAINMDAITKKLGEDPKLNGLNLLVCEYGMRVKDAQKQESKDAEAK